MSKLAADEALVRYSIRYCQPLNGYWRRMQVRANFSPLLIELEPEDASELREALKNAVETTMLCFNGGAGHGRPQSRAWVDIESQFDAKLRVDLDWGAGVLLISDKTNNHAALLRDSVRHCLSEFDLTSRELEQYDNVLELASSTA